MPGEKFFLERILLLLETRDLAFQLVLVPETVFAKNERPEKYPVRDGQCRA